MPNGTLNLNNTNTMNSLSISGGSTTLGNGARIGAMSVIGGLVNVVNTAGAVATVATADLSAGPSAVTVNTQAGSLAVTAQLRLVGNCQFNYSGGASFTVSGANLADNASPRTVTLSGGMLSMTPPTAPALTGLNYFKITGDADSGISNADVYTHAINPSGGGFSVNGVPFTGAGAGNLPAGNLGAQTYTSAGGSTITIGNVIGPSNFGNNAMTGNLSGWGGVTGNMLTFFGNFNYATTPVRTVVLTGLAPSTWYDVRLYEKQWDAATTNRDFSVGYDVGDTGTAQYTSPTIDQNQPQNTAALAALGITQPNAWAQSYVYQTGPSQTSIALAINNTNTGNTYHFYGLTNQVAPLAASTLNLPNTSVAVTANSTLDLGSASLDDTLGVITLTAGGGAGTTLTVQNANSLTVNGISAGGTSGTAAIAGPVPICIAAGHNVDVAGGVTLAIGNVIQDGPGGATALMKSDSGTLVLTASNVFTGGTTINGGTLQLGNGGGSGSIPDGSVTTNGVLAFNRSDAVNVTGQISGNGGVQQIGAGTLALVPSAGSNTYQGGTTVTNGTLSFTQGALGTGAVVVDPVSAGNSTATLLWNGNSMDLTAQGLSLNSGNTVFNLAGAGGAPVAFAGGNIGGSGALEISGGTLQIGNGGSTGGLGSVSGVQVDGGSALAFARDNITVRRRSAVAAA